MSESGISKALPCSAADLVALARDAGRYILRFYGDDIVVNRKADHSPVTEADIGAERIIVEGLSRLSPGISIVAEESASKASDEFTASSTFWLVDPLDGTKEFIAKRDEFTVNIALIRDRKPVLGVVHAPAIDTSFVGSPDGACIYGGSGSSPVPIHCRLAPRTGAVMAASRSHGDPRESEYVSALGYNVDAVIHAGSSLKFCLIAQGKADFYPRFGPTMEWDTAAGHAVLLAAGGTLKTLDDTPLLYGKPGWRNPSFLAMGRTSRA